MYSREKIATEGSNSCDEKGRRKKKRNCGFPAAFVCDACFRGRSSRSARLQKFINGDRYCARVRKRATDVHGERRYKMKAMTGRPQLATSTKPVRMTLRRFLPSWALFKIELITANEFADITVRFASRTGYLIAIL